MSDLPNLLNSVYFDNMVIMPHCKCHVFLSGKDAEIAKIIYNTSQKIGFIQKLYQKQKIKKGCYSKIQTLDITDDNTVIMTIEGISRFTTSESFYIDGYDYDFNLIEYEIFKEDIKNKDNYIKFEDIDPVFAKHFLSICEMIGMGEDKEIFDLCPFDKLINSLIMIAPMNNQERLYLSELETIEKKQKALMVILGGNELGLTSSSYYH